MYRSVAGVKIPGSLMARAAREFTQDNLPELLFNHSHRVFAFAALGGMRQGLVVDTELLYVSAMFHRTGLTAACRSANLRFEVDSANAASRFLRCYCVPEASIQEVWDAIALHTTPGIAVHKSPLIALLNRGVEVDTFGLHLGDYTPQERQQVLTAFLRGKHFKERFIDVLGAGMQDRPDTTFGTVNADILDRVDPAYRRKNFCGLVLGSNWPD